MSSDRTPYQAPASYPSPPSNLDYIPKTPTKQKPSPIFPWENHADKPSRVFPDDAAPPPNNPSGGSSSPTKEDLDSSSFTTRGNAWDDIPEISRYMSNLQKNRKGNIQVLQGYASSSTMVQEAVSSPGGAVRRATMRLTDFPTDVERPSLPVTPAPIRRPAFWGSERDEQGELPAAEGVPSQAEWVCDLFFSSDGSLGTPRHE